MLEMWTNYSKQEQEDAEKEKKENMLKDGSMMESSQLQSVEKGSDSDHKMNSSGIKDSSF